MLVIFGPVFFFRAGVSFCFFFRVQVFFGLEVFHVLGFSGVRPELRLHVSIGVWFGKTQPQTDEQRGKRACARGSISKAMKGLAGGAEGSADCRRNCTTALSHGARA